MEAFAVTALLRFLCSYNILWVNNPNNKRNPLNEKTLRYINANLNKNRCLVVKNRLLIINGALRFDVQSLNWLLILVIRDI